MRELDVGTLIADRYRLEELVGRGAAATVWRARDQRLTADVAVKLMDPAVVTHEHAARLVREARATAVLRSLHVVQLLDVGWHDEQTPFLVMELLEGETLSERLEFRGRMAAKDVAHILGQVCKAAHKAHKAGIVHRDLKPDNIFIVSDDDEEEIVKVFDFGIAKVHKQLKVGATANTRAGTMLGTPDYMSPEQIAAPASVDAHADLWAIAVIAYECLVGEVPFHGEEVIDLIDAVMTGDCTPPTQRANELWGGHHGVPPSFDAWFRKATATDPKHRFHDAREQMAMLRAALVG